MKLYSKILSMEIQKLTSQCARFINDRFLSWSFGILIGTAFTGKPANALNVQLGVANNQFSAVGTHYPLFLVKKSINPENILSVYTYLENDCSIKIDTKRRSQPTLNFYWLMSGENYKPVNYFLEDGIRKRISVKTEGTQSNSYKISVSDLSAVKHDLPEQAIEVRSLRHNDGTCIIGTLLKLGPAHNNQSIRVESFYADADFSGNIAKVEIRGTNEKGEAVFAEYQGNVD